MDQRHPVCRGQVIMFNKIIIPATLIVVAVILFFFLQKPINQPSQSPNATSSVNPALLTKLDPLTPAPDFNLPDMGGEMHTLADYKGKPAIINFWTTWCPPCRAELPSMNRAWEKVKDDGIEMIAVNVGESEDTIFTFMGDYPIDFTVLLDESGEIINQWPIRGLPTTFILDKQGNIVYRAIGGREWDSDELLDIAKSLK